MSDTPLLPADEVGFTIDADERVWPTVSVDAASHPGVADLARVHAVEGVGDVRTTARRIDGPAGALFLLGVTLSTPVRASFAVRFDLPAHREFLEAVAGVGHLVVATTDPGEVEHDRPLWLAVDLDGPALLEALDA
ncbi:MAG: hypothetical protein AAGA17_16830 [Actinomycetota bacterium]